MVGQACTRFRVLQFYGLKIGEFVLTCGATVKQSHLSLEPGLNLYWQRFPQVNTNLLTCHVTLLENFVTRIFSGFDKFDLSSIVYRLSSIVHRLPSIVYRLCFSTCCHTNDNFDLSSIVYRLSSIVYRPSSTAYRLSSVF